MTIQNQTAYGPDPEEGYIIPNERAPFSQGQSPGQLNCEFHGPKNCVKETGADNRRAAVKVTAL